MVHMDCTIRLHLTITSNAQLYNQGKMAAATPKPNKLRLIFTGTALFPRIPPAACPPDTVPGVVGCGLGAAGTLGAADPSEPPPPLDPPVATGVPAAVPAGATLLNVVAGSAMPSRAHIAIYSTQTIPSAVRRALGQIRNGNSRSKRAFPPCAAAGSTLRTQSPQVTKASSARIEHPQPGSMENWQIWRCD